MAWCLLTNFVGSAERGARLEWFSRLFDEDASARWQLLSNLYSLEPHWFTRNTSEDSSRFDGFVISLNFCIQSSYQSTFINKNVHSFGILLLYCFEKELIIMQCENSYHLTYFIVVVLVRFLDAKKLATKPLETFRLVFSRKLRVFPANIYLCNVRKWSGLERKYE